MIDDRGRSRQILPVIIVGAAVSAAIIAAMLTAPPPVPGIDETSPVVRSSLAAVRALLDSTLAASIGIALVPLLAKGKRMRIALTATRYHRWTSFGYALAAVVSIVLQTADYAPRSPLGAQAVMHQIGIESSAKALLVIALLGVAGGVSSSRLGSTLPVEVRLGVSVCAAIPTALTGHFGGDHSDFAVIGLAVHVVAALVWMGGLAASAILCLGFRERLAQVLPRFSTLAGVCFGLVVLTGSFNGLIELSSVPGVSWWSLLFSSSYGQLLLLKTFCLILAGAAAAHLRWRALPLIARRRRVGVLSWIGVELLLLATATGAAAVLSRAAVTPN